MAFSVYAFIIKYDRREGVGVAFCFPVFGSSSAPKNKLRLPARCQPLKRFSLACSLTGTWSQMQLKLWPAGGRVSPVSVLLLHCLMFLYFFWVLPTLAPFPPTCSEHCLQLCKSSSSHIPPQSVIRQWGWRPNQSERSEMSAESDVCGSKVHDEVKQRSCWMAPLSAVRLSEVYLYTKCWTTITTQC